MSAGPALTRSVSWPGEGGRSFGLSLDGDAITLTRDDERLATLSVAEWEDVCAGLDGLARFRRKAPGKPRVYRGTPEAPSNGRAWIEEMDTALSQGWYAGDGLAALAARFGRTEGSIASRMARLDIVADRDEARQRP